MPDDEQRLLDALTSPIRREILWLVWDRELPAGDIAAAFEVTAPTISQHLAVLREAGLVDMRVDGNFRRYRANVDAFSGLEALLAHTGRWRGEADDGAKGPDATRTTTGHLAVVAVDLDHDATATFTCLTDPDRCARWVGAPVTIEDGRFECTTARGTRVRGTLDVVAPSSLLALRWESKGDEVPRSGRERTVYLRLHPTIDGCRVEVHQHAATDAEAADLGAFWGAVLHRLRSNAGAALAD